MSYTHFTLEERKYLQKLLSEGYSFRKIAAILERSPSSVSREVNRNRAKWKPHRKPDNKYWYNHWRAQNLYAMRRRDQRRRALEPDCPQWNYIVSKLRLYWSPEEISKRWALENPTERGICVSTVYRYAKQGLFPEIQVKTHFRRRGKRMTPRNSNYNSIQPERTIPEWPEEIRRRIRVGDWEGDTIYGSPGKGLLVSLVDRKSRYLRLGIIKSRSAAETRKAMVELLSGLPVNSISLDNGSEFSEFKQLERELDTQVYFAQPHKPWQRGTNENTNDIVRFFFPKGFNFHKVTLDEVRKVEELINNRPRKCLGWKTPHEVFSLSVALA